MNALDAYVDARIELDRRRHDWNMAPASMEDECRELCQPAFERVDETQDKLRKALRELFRVLYSHELSSHDPRRA